MKKEANMKTIHLEASEKLMASLVKLLTMELVVM